MDVAVGDLDERLLDAVAEGDAQSAVSTGISADTLIANETEPATIADGARTISLGDLNWEIIKTGAAGILEVTDEAIAEAMKLYFGLANLKCEPTGALSLGAVLSDKTRFAGKRICLVVSGGNVDPSIYAQIISSTDGPE